MQKRAAIYARVSTEEQAHNFSIPNQIEQLRAYCARQGYEIVGEYIDPGYSGTSPSRPDYTRLLDDCRNGRIDIVVVYRVDRFFRSSRHLFNALHELEQWNVDFASATEPYDTGTSADKAMLGMISTFAELERNTFMERSHHGMRRAVEAGQYSGGIVAYGYRYDPGTKRLVIDDEEAAVVRRIFDMCVREGASTAAIAARLNAEGIPTKYARAGRGVRGKDTANKWRAGRINNVLKNRAYCGEWEYGRRTKKRRPELTRGQCPALVDRAIVDAAAAQLARNNAWADRNARRSYLLRGKIVCGKCGHKYTGNYYRIARGGERQYYRCNRDAARAQYPGEQCGAAPVHAGQIEPIIWDDISGYIRHPDTWRVLTRQATTQSTDDTGEGLRRIEGRLRDLQTAEERLLDLYTDPRSTLSRATLDTRSGKIAHDRRECEEQRAALLDQRRTEQDRRGRMGRAEALLASLRDDLEDATEDIKRQIIQLLVKSVVVAEDPDGTPRWKIEYAFMDTEGRDTGITIRREGRAATC